MRVWTFVKKVMLTLGRRQVEKERDNWKAKCESLVRERDTLKAKYEEQRMRVKGLESFQKAVEVQASHFAVTGLLLVSGHH